MCAKKHFNRYVLCYILAPVCLGQQEQLSHTDPSVETLLDGVWQPLLELDHTFQVFANSVIRITHSRHGTMVLMELMIEVIFVTSVQVDIYEVGNPGTPWTNTWVRNYICCDDDDDSIVCVYCIILSAITITIGMLVSVGCVCICIA